jgi:Flp pilus assembly protein TadD
MQYSAVWSVGRVLFAMAMIALPLMGCSSTGIDAFGAFGDAPMQAADLPNVAAYDAASALREARAHFRVGDFGYSAALYKRYVELTRNDPEGYVGLAASYDRLRRFDLADRVYAALFQLTGGTAQYYNNLGYSYLLRGDTATALANLRKANQLDPQNATIANNLRMLANATKQPPAPRPQA